MGVLFAMMNVVTAFFVESALKAARDDEKNECRKQLNNVFQTRAGLDNKISKEHFSGMLLEPEMQEFLEALELNPAEEATGDFWTLLDQDSSGHVSADELVKSCLRLTGPAKAIELAAVAQEMRTCFDVVFQRIDARGPAHEIR